eukprot:g3409.t1
MSEKRKKDALVDSPVLQGVWDNLKKQPRIPHQRRQRKRSSAPPHPFNIHSDVPKNIKTGSFSFEKRTPSLERRRPKGLCLDMSLLDSEDDDDNNDMIREEKTAVDVGMNMVLPHLYISGSGPARNTSRLLDLGITHVINCCVHRAQSSDSSRFHVLDLKLNDSSSSDVVMYIYMTIDFVESARLNGGKVLIHCLKGISRSASLVISYLMWSKNINNVREVLSIVQRSRPSCNPNGDFLVQLRHWARHRPSMSKTSTFLYRIASHRTRRGKILASVRGPISGRELYNVAESSSTTTKRRKMSSPTANSSSSSSASSCSSTTTLTEDLLLSRLECFVLCTPERLYVWYDVRDVYTMKLHEDDCRMKFMKLVVSYFQRFESCTSHEIQFLERGHETDSFWFDMKKASSVDGVLTPRLLEMSMGSSSSSFRSKRGFGSDDA